MTSPSWCPACEESCPNQPDGICTTCGEQLEQPLTSTENTYATESSQTSTSQQHDPVAIALLASSGIDASLINQLGSIPINTNQQGNNDISDLSAILPPEALNPQAGSTRHRPVSKKVLDGLKRVVITPQSAELFDAQISLFECRSVNDLTPCVTGGDKCLNLNAVPGEFGPRTASDTNASGSLDKLSKTAALVVCSPRTTKGGLSSTTIDEIASLRHHRIPFVAYVERGDGITFVQKAIACQHAGVVNGKSSCIGVIVGNAGAGKEVWPYAMQDTSNEATELGLSVPVVMIRREDGTRLVQWARSIKQTDSTTPNTTLQYTPVQLHIHSKDEHACPVCADSYEIGATTVRLPTCGHVFHESCALMWLTKHNTCPYCRKELPTEDEEYEIERRRREAREVGGGGGSSFYG